MALAYQPSPKTERLETRCTKAQKDTLQQAVALVGGSLTDFTISACMEKAEKIIKEYNMLDLTVNDQKAFVKALLEPAAPNKALQEARDRYLREVKS